MKGVELIGVFERSFRHFKKSFNANIIYYTDVPCQKETTTGSKLNRDTALNSKYNIQR
eukprot:gene10676-3297_t